MSSKAAVLIAVRRGVEARVFRHLLRRSCLSALLLAVGACAHIGPKTIVTDRFNYSDAIGASWKQQTLLNIVKMRNADLPVFVDVSSVVSGYSLETNLNISGFHSPADPDTVTVGASGSFTDRPTITYTPMTGDKFLRSLINPIEPKNLFALVEDGYPADFILGLAVDSINGVRNRVAAVDAVRPADPDFLRALALLRQLQLAGGVGLRIEDLPGHPNQPVLVFARDKQLAPEYSRKADEVRRLLKLSPSQQTFALVYSPIPEGEDKIAVKTRSMLQIMTTFSSYIDEGTSERHAQPAADVQPTIHIRSGPHPPATSYAQVQYRGRWYWIDSDDLLTKRALTTIVLLFTLSDAGGNVNVPQITIPAQ